MNFNASLAGFFIAAALVGLVSSVQPGMNARLGAAAGSPLYGGLANFCVGILLVLVVLAALYLRGSIGGPNVQQMVSAPWWSWLGGVLGAFYVCTAIFVVPKIGGVNYFVCIVVGQIVGHLIIDRWGLLGLSAHPITPTRVTGVVLVVVGMLLVTIGSKADPKAQAKPSLEALPVKASP
jgi:transporter family-2 protein